MGKHIHVKTGSWTETTSGIGSNADSFYEYLIKAHALWGATSDWLAFAVLYGDAMKSMRRGDWSHDVDMFSGALARFARARAAV